MTFLKQWRFTLILISSVMVGALLGYTIGPKAENLKPLGDVFLNLLFTAVVPLVFFSLSSAIASNSDLKRLGRMAGLMLAMFIITGIISSCLMILAVKTFDPARHPKRIRQECLLRLRGNEYITALADKV